MCSKGQESIGSSTALLLTHRRPMEFNLKLKFTRRSAGLHPFYWSLGVLPNPIHTLAGRRWVIYRTLANVRSISYQTPAPSGNRRQVVASRTLVEDYWDINGMPVGACRTPGRKLHQSDSILNGVREQSPEEDRQVIPGQLLRIFSRSPQMKSLLPSSRQSSTPGNARRLLWANLWELER